MPVIRCLLLLTLLCTSTCFAVEYGPWQTGITREQMVSVAHEQNLSIAREGTFSTRQAPAGELVLADALEFYYVTELYQSHARVKLVFTPQASEAEPLLSQIEAVFTDKEDHRRLLPYLARQLTEHYGRGQTKKNFLQKELILSPDHRTEIRLIHNAATLKLRHTDLVLRGPLLSEG